MKKLSPREIKRLMQRTGMAIETLEGVKEVIIKLADRSLIIRSPQVSLVKVAGQSVYQVLGEISEVLEREEVEIPDEDVQLVASQAGVCLEEARRALKEAKGDLVKAILVLKARG
ncbi:MAG: nascent polypeptide-associated complex protein [Candidatus Nezhaarchaeota archaeon]|nr:nascent polypeptide-associated complex protein [Candidatus Nezhaarchaeota archaeon]